MATPADVISQTAAAFEALGGTRTRMSTDYRDDLDVVASGATKYQLRLVPAGTLAVSSNTTRTVCAVQIICVHRLATITAEATYTAGTMATDLTSLSALSWWRAMAAVYDCLEIDAKAERIGHAVVYTITATVTVA